MSNWMALRVRGTGDEPLGQAAEHQAIAPRRTVVCRLVGSDEATSGSAHRKGRSLIAGRAATAPASVVRWAGVAKAVQQLDVAGVRRRRNAVEHPAAQGRRPMASMASGASSPGWTGACQARPLAQRGQEQVPQTSSRASAFRSSTNGGG